MKISKVLSRQKIQELAEQQRHNEIATIFEAESKERDLEIWHLVSKSRSILLGENGPLPLEAAGEALQEAVERDPEYAPALIDLGYYLDTFDVNQEEAAIKLFERAAEVVLDELLDVIRGWAEAKLLDSEVRKEMLRSYNQLLQTLASAGLEAGKPALRLTGVEESEEV